MKTWNVLRYLSERGHQISLATFVRPEEENYLKALEEVCTDVFPVPIRRSRIQDVYYLIRSQITHRPFLIERDDLDEMRRVVQNCINAGDLDCIYADQLTMSQFALQAANGNTNGHKRPLLIFDAHNAVWTTFERMAETTTWYLRPLIQREARQIKDYQTQVVCTFDHTFTVTDVDRQFIQDAVSVLNSSCEETLSANVSVFPITVDTKTLLPVQRKPSGPHILTLGTLHYPPNADGIRWFANEVFPLVRQQLPEVKLTIVGKNPPPDFLRLANHNSSHIVVTGYVPDLLPYYESSTLVVVPVRAGSGMRVRILETFAHGMPTVTTTVGLEGIDAVPNEDVLVADTVDDFATAVLKLLRDQQLQQKLAVHGRRLAETRYDWQVALKGLDEVFNGLQAS